MKWKDLFQEFIYSLSTNDKYSEYDSRKSFNRVNKPETELLYSANNNESSASLHDEAAPGGSPLNSKSHEGIHEVRLAWRHIHQWLKKYTPELSSTLESPCTDADLNDFQKDLNIKLPECVAEFFKLTDGQSSYNENGSGGVLFGLKLLPLEEIMILTEHWRKVAKTLDEEDVQRSRASKANGLAKLNSIHGDDEGEVAGGGKKSSPTHARTFTDSEFGSNYTSRNNSSHSLTSPLTAVSSMAYPSASSSLKNKNDSKIPNLVIPKQKCIPPGRIQPVFAHPLWIPIFTDEVGNCMGIDLYPPNPDHWGQVILFGREFDTKYLIADNFGDFLLIFANDLEIGNWEIKKTYDETNFGNLMIGNDGEFVFVDKQDTKLEVNYFEVLKKRSIQKWIAGLESEANGLSSENKALIETLKNELKTMITLKNGKSIDEFINSNLTLIDKVNTPLNEDKEAKGLPTKSGSQRKPSPLKIVTEVEELKIAHPSIDIPSGESTSHETVKESKGKDLTEVQI